MAAQMMTVKISYGKEMRRFSQSAPLLSWGALSKRVIEVFSLAPASQLALTYVDEDGDQITVSTDEELADAVGLALSHTPAVLRLTLVRPTRAASPAKDRPEAFAPAGREGVAPQGVAPEVLPFLKAMAGKMGPLPEDIRAALAGMELDVAATAAANGAPGAGTPQPGVHVGVTCDRSGMSPIVGDRFHLVGHNYDVCQAEYDKLPAKEQALYRKIPPPSADANPNRIHPGVECDRSGMCPIVGTRYHLRGHDFDLCQAEYDKLDEKDQAHYEAIEPPTLAPPAAAGASMAWRPGMWGCRARQAWSAANGGRWERQRPCDGSGAGGAPKLTARFVRDVSVFDGTQMPPGTPITKIWLLKNSGDAPWPAGTKMTFVGGDQMSTDALVPLARQTAVQPGEEVDVAVEMLAPQEHGRYLGYWRLVGPHGRRKFGQRVWCHIQVVDPANPQSALGAFDDLSRTLAEIETKKAELAANEPDAEMDAADDKPAAMGLPPAGDCPAPAPTVADVCACPGGCGMLVTWHATHCCARCAKSPPGQAKHGPKCERVLAKPTDKTTAKATTPVEEAPEVAAEVGAEGAVEAAVEGAAAPSPEATGIVPAMLVAPCDPEEKADVDASHTAAAEWSDGAASDDMVVVTDGMLLEAGAQPTNLGAGVSAAASGGFEEVLHSMGFEDVDLVRVVARMHATDLDACTRALTEAREWTTQLQDLNEMGFTNRELNAELLLKNRGNIKKTVRDLVEM